MKNAARFAVNSESSTTPNRITSDAKNLPAPVCGTTSPYPTVAMVTHAHHMPSHAEPMEGSIRDMMMPDNTMVTSATISVVPSLCCESSLRADFDMRNSSASTSTRRTLRNKPVSGANCQNQGKPPVMEKKFNHVPKG